LPPKYPGLFTLLVVILSLLIVYGVRYYERHFSAGASGLIRSDLDLTEFRLGEVFAVSGRTSGWNLTGKIKNKSSKYTLTYLVVGIVIKDCADGNCDPAGEAEETIQLTVPPGEMASMEMDVHFRNMKKLSPSWSWYYKIVSIGAEVKGVSASLP
jgi:hypothetical protein